MLTVAKSASDTAAMRTTTVQLDDECVVNGSKIFITNAECGNAFMLLAKTDAEMRLQHHGFASLARRARDQVRAVSA